MRPRWVVPAVVAFVVVVVLAVVLALVRGGDGSGQGVAPPPPSYDPPAVFAEKGTQLPRELDDDVLPAVLDGFDAFVALPSGLSVIDTRTGGVLAEIPPEAEEASGAPPRAPVLVTLSGRPAAVAAFRVTVPGHGTTVGHDAIELVAVDVAERTRAARARIDLPPSLSESGRLRTAWPVGAGVPSGGSGALVVVTAQVGPDLSATSYAVDLASGSVRWQVPGLTAGAVAGGLVIGAQRVTGGQRLGAVALADGRQAWGAGTPSSTVTVWPAGPASVAAATVSPGNGERLLVLADAATGRVLARRSVGGGLTCRFDGRLTTVCWSESAGGAWAAGFDANSGRALWELPAVAAGRVAPAVSTAWHGVVYGTTDNGPVALDARTGADRPRAPGVAPDLVNAYVGLVAATIDRPRPSAHLATG